MLSTAFVLFMLSAAFVLFMLSAAFVVFMLSAAFYLYFKDVDNIIDSNIDSYVRLGQILFYSL